MFYNRRHDTSHPTGQLAHTAATIEQAKMTQTAAPPTAQALVTLSHFIHRLKTRHLQLNRSNAATTATEIALSLAYGDALLRHAVIRPQLTALPTQIAVIGPTQAGKSTIVNLLLGCTAAEASPLAGFTRHAQGFSSDPLTGALSESIGALFGDWQQADREQLTNQALESYSLSHVESQNAFAAQPWIVWDTPDFDSVSSRSYRNTVPLLCATADLIVLVVSKEKYADQSVWQTLRLIAPIEKPLLICINKVPDEATQTLVASMRMRLEKEQVSYHSVTALPYLEKSNSAATLSSSAGQALRREAAGLLAQLSEPRQQPAVSNEQQLSRWLNQHWQQWLTPLRQEAAAQQQWQESVEQSLANIIDLYSRDYLNHPNYSETLQKAILRLLELLEIPGIAASLAAARQLLTWPARKAMALFQSARAETSVAAARGQESAILSEAVNHNLLTLQDSLISGADDNNHSSHWQRGLACQLRREKPTLEAATATAIEAHQHAFQTKIDAAADKLYHHLQEHPVTLNGLRAARISVDAGAIALTLKSGGINLHDVALTPALVAFTSLITESAVGHYMRTVESELKRQQLTSVRYHLIENLLTPGLVGLPRQMPDDGLYLLPNDAVDAAENALETLAS